MRVVLKVASGPLQGRSILLQAGQLIKVGRTEWADFAIPHDDRLSGMHFALQCDGQQCRLRDLESTNGTMVNGVPTLDTLLNDGDQIVAGRTSFVVEVEGIVQPAVAETVSEAGPERRRSTRTSRGTAGGRLDATAVAAGILSSSRRATTSH